MKDDLADRFQKELTEWRTKLDELRVRASLGKLELRDKEREWMDRFEPAFRTAMQKLSDVKDEADDRSVALRAGIEAGWKELRATYRSVREGRPKPP